MGFYINEISVITISNSEKKLILEYANKYIDNHISALKQEPKERTINLINTLKDGTNTFSFHYKDIALIASFGYNTKDKAYINCINRLGEEMFNNQLNLENHH